MNRRLQPPVDPDTHKLWITALCFLVALAFYAALCVDDYEPRERPRGTTEVWR